MMEEGIGKSNGVNPFAGIPIPNLLDIILHGPKQSDEAMY